MEPGAGPAAAIGAAAGLRPRRSRPARAGFRPYRHRMRQARLRRPRGVVRRPRFCRCADARPCCAPPTTMRAASWSASTPRLSCGRAARTAASRDCWSAAPTSSPAAGIGEPTGRRRHRRADVSRLGAVAGDTCHVDVIDRWGNMVSATPSGGWLQSSPVIPELGFCLGTRLQMFWLDEGCRRACARQAPAQHACRRSGVQGRRALHRVRHPGRRPAGPVVGCSFSCTTSITG